MNSTHTNISDIVIDCFYAVSLRSLCGLYAVSMLYALLIIYYNKISIFIILLVKNNKFILSKYKFVDDYTIKMIIKQNNIYDILMI